MNLRHSEILGLARSVGKVTVDGLAAHFGVTLQTIRRDLTELAEAGQLTRVHGGAVLPSGTTNIAYQERRQWNAEAKARIAAAAAALVPENASLFLNIGTTTEAVATALLHHRGLFVVTNNMNVATILTANPDARVTVTGGRLRPADGGLLGPITTDTIARFKADIAIAGCSAIDAAGDLYDFDEEEVAATQAFLAHARQRIVVADASKLTRAAPARIGSLSDIDALVTDAPLPAPLSRAVTGWPLRTELA